MKIQYALLACLFVIVWTNYPSAYVAALILFFTIMAISEGIKPSDPSS